MALGPDRGFPGSNRRGSRRERGTVLRDRTTLRSRRTGTRSDRRKASPRATRDSRCPTGLRSRVTQRWCLPRAPPPEPEGIPAAPPLGHQSDPLPNSPELLFVPQQYTLWSACTAQEKAAPEAIVTTSLKGVVPPGLDGTSTGTDVAE